MQKVDVIASGRNSYVQVTNEGESAKWVGFKTELAAHEAAKAMEAGYSDPEPITLGTFFDRFMAHHAIPNLSPETVQRYHAVYEGHIRVSLGDTLLPSIQSADVKVLAASLEDAGQSKRRTKSVMDVLSAVLGIGVKWDYIESNPVDGVDY